VGLAKRIARNWKKMVGEGLKHLLRRNWSI
jgi:hypothetical protein